MKRIVKYIAAGGITLILIMICGIFMEGLPASTIWWEQFYRMPRRELKTALMGSSHCYCSFDPDIFEKELGGKAIQLGHSSIDMVPLEFQIQEVFKWQQPELVVIEAYSFIDRGQWNKEDRIKEAWDSAMKAMRWGSARIRGNAEMFGVRAALRKMIPFWDNHSNWENPGYVETRLKYIFKPDTVEKAWRYNKHDSTMTEKTIKQYEEMEDNPHKWSMDKDQRDAFKRIAGMCQENNARLIVVMAPIYKGWRSHVDYSGRHREIEALTEECNVPFLDYNDPELYERIGVDESWFRDDLSLDIGNTHLNTHGAELLSAHLAGWLKDIE